MKQSQFYSYRQGTSHYVAPLRIEDNNSGCISVFISALFFVVSAVVSFLLVYWGYKLLVSPILINAWETLTHALAGG